jgi:hypothetical protein
MTPEAPVTVGPDPYLFEIYGYTDLWRLCAECRKKSALEV